VAIHSLTLRATEVDLSAYVGSDLAPFAPPDVIIFCFAISRVNRGRLVMKAGGLQTIRTMGAL